MTISAVFPAPTSWNKPTAGSEMIRATAVRWWGWGVNVLASPEQLIRVIPMPENGITPKVVEWGLPDIPVPGLEQQSREDVELFEEPDSEE